jgi:uncharacterized protein with HEPN domain
MRTDRLRLLDAIEQIELIFSFSERGRESFFHDLIVQSAVLHRLALLGEACRGIFPGIAQSSSRDSLAANCRVPKRRHPRVLGIDLELAWAIVAEHLALLAAQLNSVVASLPG